MVDYFPYILASYAFTITMLGVLLGASLIKFIKVIKLMENKE